MTIVLAALAGALVAPALVEVLTAVRAPRRDGRIGRAGVVVLARLGRGLGARAPRGLEDRIAAAGLDVPAKDVTAVKGGAAVAGLALALAMLPAAPGRLGPAMLIVAPAAGFLAPDVWLGRRARRRRRMIEAELADVLDLMRVAVAAGLSPGRALGEVGRRHPGLLAAELRRVAGLTALGVSRERAYGDFERRCPATGIAGTLAALRRAERHGAPLGAALQAEAAAARGRSAQAAAEAAARASPQIQLVVALLLVPAVLLLVAAALVPAVVPA